MIKILQTSLEMQEGRDAYLDGYGYENNPYNICGNADEAKKCKEWVFGFDQARIDWAGE